MKVQGHFSSWLANSWS